MNWSYIAGFFDGEGCIVPRPLAIILVQKETKVLDAIKDFLSDNNIKGYRRHSNSSGLGELRIYRQKHCYKFLESIIGEIVVKKEHALEVMEIIRNNPVKEVKYHIYPESGKVAIKALRNGGLTHREIKDAMGCGLGTVYRTLSGSG